MNKKQFLFLSSLMLVSPFLKASYEAPENETKLDLAEHAVGFATSLGATALLMIGFYNIEIKDCDFQGDEKTELMKYLLQDGALVICLANAGMLGAEKLLSGAEPGVAKTTGKFVGGFLPLFALSKIRGDSIRDAAVEATVCTALLQFSNWAGRKVYKITKK